MTAEAPANFSRTERRPGLTRRRLIAGLGFAGAGALVLPATGAYAAREAANDLVVTHYRLTPPRWPAGQRLSICVIADIHAGGPNMGIARVRQVVDAGNALKCDLTVLLGDYFATHPFVTERVPAPAWAAELKRLSAPLGVYAIYGNHDWWYDIDGHARGAAPRRHPGDGERGGAVGRAGRALLAGRPRRPARALDRPAPFRGRRRPARHAAAHRHRRSGDPARARARHFPGRARTRRAHARRPHPWRPDQVAVRAAALGAVGIRRALRLRPHRRTGPPPDRVGRARLLQGAAAPRRAAGNLARCDLGVYASALRTSTKSGARRDAAAAPSSSTRFASALG